MTTVNHVKIYYEALDITTIAEICTQEIKYSTINTACLTLKKIWTNGTTINMKTTFISVLMCELRFNIRRTSFTLYFTIEKKCTSLPLVSPFSIHSTVTLSLSSFRDVTIA